MSDIFDNFSHNRSESNPQIYAYRDNNYPGMLKVGFTTKDIDKRVAEQYSTLRPGETLPYEIVIRESAMRSDGTSFTDKDVHRLLNHHGIPNQRDSNNHKTEWFRCTEAQVKNAILSVRDYTDYSGARSQDFKMRPEQKRAVEKTKAYFEKENRGGKCPKFLWNAKMRFGKTFASYQLAKKMNMKRVLVLTFKPAVESAWEEDLNSHIDFDGWQFYSRKTPTQPENLDQSKPIVCFGSFQDFLGTNENGGIKAQNEWVHNTKWDLVIFDEYHFGAWRDSARKLFDDTSTRHDDDYDTLDIEEYEKEEMGNAIDETFLPIKTKYYLYLSGTPFRAINSGEFIEDEIFNWTYTDEQEAKECWDGPREENPYLSLPRMVLMVYKIPESITQIAAGGEFDEFDLNEFFRAEVAQGQSYRFAQFKHKNEVQKWLDLIRGSYTEDAASDLKVDKPLMPYSDVRMLNYLNHSLWFLPNVNSCYAMKNLLDERQNTFYHDYKINVCAGADAGIGLDALPPIQESMHNPLESKTITLSCGKLTTGVTVKPWTGILMLRNLKSPETYFQAAFRVQSPWIMRDDEGQTEILKKECYVFDFAINRALRQISDYSCNLNVKESNPEKKVGEFIKYLPVLAYDGATMKQVNAGEILDLAMSGTSGTLLARRWQSANLVRTDNMSLQKLLNDPELLDALMQIEDFRSLNSDIETVINKSEKVKKAKKSDKPQTPKEKKELSEEEKEYKSLRKKIQEKLIKLATRIPIFMYLTDYREYSLVDVIRHLESDLFKRVTGLEVSDFNKLCEIGIFNRDQMNNAVFGFKRYEDSSLNYIGIDKHAEEEQVGGFDETISKKEFEKLAKMQAETMEGVTAEAIVENFSRGMGSENIKPKSIISTAPAVEENEAEEEEEETINLLSKSKTKPESEEQKPKFVDDIKVGDKISHTQFGNGEVIDIMDGRSKIRVQFSSIEKTFMHPQVFEWGVLKKR